MQKWLLTVLLVVALAAMAWYVAPYTPVNATLLALIIGFVVGQLLPLSQQTGVRWFESQGLGIAVALLGVQFSLSTLLTVELHALILIVSSLLLTCLVTWVMVKLTQGDRASGWLVASGQGICGTAAVMAVQKAANAPAVKAALVVAVINFLGFVGVFVTPLLINSMGLSDPTAIGLMLGNTLQSMGHVVAASSIYSEPVIQMAVWVKMCRILFLVPVLLTALWYFGAKASAQESKEKLSWWRLVPWFIWAFVLLLIVANVFELPTTLTDWLSWLSEVLFVLAMVAIGMAVRLSDLYQQGGRLLLLAAGVFIIQLAFNGWLLHSQLLSN